MSSDSVNGNSGFVGAGTNLQKNVLLATSTPSVKIDLANAENSATKDPSKLGFWQSVVNFRENIVKSKSSENLKNLGKNCILENVKKQKHQIEDKPSQAPHNLDDAGDCISELIGHIGLWQVVWVVFLIMFQVPSAFHIFSFMFQTIQRDFWCEVPTELDTSSLSISDWKRMSAPLGSCQTPNNFTEFIQSNGSLSENSKKCEHFLFDTTLSQTTIQSEWNIVCDKAWLLGVIEMCFLAGAAIGSLSSGTLSDEYGRRHTLMIAVALQATIGTSIGFIQSLVPYMIMRFALGFVSMSIVNISFVLTVEMVTGKWSNIIGTLDLLPLPLAYILISVIAYFTRNWRNLQFIISVPWFALLLFWFVLPESPRWLLAKGRIDELKKLIEKAAQWNKITLPPNYEKTLSVPCEEDSHGSILDLFKMEYLRTSLLLIVAWYALVLQYMAISLHIGELGGSIYFTPIYAGIFESVAILISIFLVNRFGIQKNIFYNVLIAGVSLIVALYPNLHWAVIVFLALLGKSTTGVANAMIPAFTSFQYPPTLRTRAMGITNLSGGFALICVPYVWPLKEIAEYLPSLVLGLSGLVGALVLFFIDDRSAMIIADERRDSNRRMSQAHIGK